MGCRCQQMSMFAKRNRMRDIAKKLANDEQQTFVLYIIEQKYFLYTTLTYAISQGIEYVEEVTPDKVNTPDKVEVSTIEQMQDNDVL